MNKLCAPIKKALVAKFGRENVTVRNGSGTAWGWVEIGLQVSEPLNCVCKPGDCYCPACREAIGSITKEAYKLIHEALNSAGLKPYTYCADDGYNTDSEEILLDVKFKKSAPVEDRPEYGKVYALTGGPDTKALSNGNSWAESIVE